MSTESLSPNALKRLELVADELRGGLAASRVTIRLKRGDDYPVVVESDGPGTPRIMHKSYPNMQTLPTFKFLAAHKKPLVQNDTRTGEAAWPPLYENSRLISQVLWPVLNRDDFLGFVAVHEIGDIPRVWSPSDQAAIEHVASEIAELCA